MIAYVAHIVKEVIAGDKSLGDDWQVWVGTATSESNATEQVEALVQSFNRAEPLEPDWEVQTIEPFDIATLLAGGQVKATEFFISEFNALKGPVVINMLQASDKEAEDFAKEPDIDPNISDDPCSPCPVDAVWCQCCAIWPTLKTGA